MLTASALLFLALSIQDPAASAAPLAPTPEPKPTPDGPVVAVETTMGTFQIAFYASKAPASTRNIMRYMKNGFYVGTIFHRVIPNFMVQGGGMDAKMEEKQPLLAPVRNEAKNGLLNTRGSVALARTNDPHSATAQFFVNVKDNPMLDFGVSRDGWGYAVFGEVVSGMEVVDAIVAVPTTRMGVHENVPMKPVLVKAVRVISEPAPVAPPAAKASAPAAVKPGARPAAAAPKAAPKASPKAPSKPAGR
jgi:cyclophilin family peptidyl-prolyl cis-trans isomerase